MIHYVRLSKLPDDLQIPEDLRERIWYDEPRQRLAFDGFMSKATFDRLEQLHDDFEYSRALEELFRIAVPEGRQPPSRHRALLLLAAGLLIVLTVGAVGICQWCAG